MTPRGAYEAYSAAMPYPERGTDRYQASLREIRDVPDWMAANQQGRGAQKTWDYASQWGSKLGGLPFHMYIYARHLPDGDKLFAAADQELAHIGRLLAADPKPGLSQLTVFAMMSYAKRLRPGAMYRPREP